MVTMTTSNATTQPQTFPLDTINVNGAHADQQGGSRIVEAGSDPRGHLWNTWGVYLCAGKPPLADIILSHPPDLT